MWKLYVYNLSSAVRAVVIEILKTTSETYEIMDRITEKSENLWLPSILTAKLFTYFLEPALISFTIKIILIIVLPSAI